LCLFELGVLGLEPAQLCDELVVFCIRDLGSIVAVIALGVVGDKSSKFLDALFYRTPVLSVRGSRGHG
jgi:hypothetical protein